MIERKKQELALIVDMELPTMHNHSQTHMSAGKGFDVQHLQMGRTFSFPVISQIVKIPARVRTVSMLKAE